MKNECFHESICFVKACVGDAGGRKKRFEDGKQNLCSSRKGGVFARTVTAKGFSNHLHCISEALLGKLDVKTEKRPVLASCFRNSTHRSGIVDFVRYEVTFPRLECSLGQSAGLYETHGTNLAGIRGICICKL